MPVRVSDPLVGRVQELADLVVGQHALGHVDAERADARPTHESAAQADHSLASPAATAAASTIANMSSPRHGQLAVHGRLDPGAADGTVHGDDLGLERDRVAGLADALEADLVDAGEEADLVAARRSLGGRQRLVGRSVRPGAGRGDRRRLRQRLDDEHAGHDRVAGEVPREPPVVVAERADRYAAHARLPVDDLVDEKERRAVRQQREHLFVSQLHSGFNSLVRRR